MVNDVIRNEKLREMRKTSERFRTLERERTKRWRENNPEKEKEKNRKSKEKRKERDKELQRIYCQTHKEKIAERVRLKRKRDKMARINHSINSAIVGHLQSKNIKKSKRRWEDLVGYTVEQLIKHLEKKFLPGMSWNNYGKPGWHIDHKIPKSAFNFSSTDDIDFKKAWALKNLQPLWAHDNQTKGDKLNSPFQPSLLIQA